MKSLPRGRKALRGQDLTPLIRMKKQRIGFVSTRLAGTDGVSLETRKWVEVLEREGHETFFMAGELDTSPDRSFLVPECHFTHPEVTGIYRECFDRPLRKAETTRSIELFKQKLKDALREFVRKFNLDLLIPENALTIPLNIPLGLAITELAVETGIPMIAHHHDFFWERKRFLRNCCWDYLNKAFPPYLPMIQHVVLNSSQDNQLSLRTGISAVVIPNVMNFRNPPPAPDGYAADLRNALGISPNEKFILQPTRIVKRKGIEHAIELVHRLGLPAKLVISHASGDEGDEYAHRVREYSELLGVNSILCSGTVEENRATRKDGRKIYALSDLYREADLVTYPSTIEGFGNAFLEAIYYKCPILVNNYTIYHSDIGPKGFRTLLMDDYISAETVRRTQQVLENPELAEEMTEHNYELAARFFSYEVLQQKLLTMLVNCFGS